MKNEKKTFKLISLMFKLEKKEMNDENLID